MGFFEHMVVHPYSALKGWALTLHGIIITWFVGSIWALTLHGSCLHFWPLPPSPAQPPPSPQPPFCATCKKPSKTVCISIDSPLWSSKAARRRRTAVPERKEPRPVTPTAPDCSSGTKMSLGRCYFQYKRAWVPLNCRHKYGFALPRIGSALGKDQLLLH